MNTLLQKTFENEFNADNYKDLVVNLFNRFDFSKEQSLKQHFTEDEKQKIKDLTYLGTFEDTEKKSLDVLIVELQGGSKVERARSLQRNLIGKYLKGNLKDSALVAFYSKDNPDWRLSFVRMDYRIGDTGAKVEIGTPPKRYSFLVGETEPSHTAKKQLQPIISPDVTPTVLDVEKAFSIEKVTKEFYNRIAEMFTKLVGGERKIGSRKIAETGSLKLPSTTGDTIKKEFAVRLIGRLLFCWFLKKKKSDNDIPLMPPAILSSNAIETYPNYYHSLLEPLFFQVLNTPVEKRDKRVRNELWLKIPFLNGGLFEPHQYDFYGIDVLGTSKFLNTLKVPDEWFTELFRIFEEYNFTIDESSTIDIEISVDPEMLGRIFENLLAEINPETGETARKSTGSYYTPRPIVEYMVDESLKQYLLSQIPTLEKGGKGGFSDETKLSRLLSYGDFEIDLTEPEKDTIIDALDRVKIIDPACGSGAFPMGILHKMLLILQKIDPESKKWLSKKLPKIDNKLLRHEVEAELKKKNWDYIHKLGIIQYSIYGVDIQPIAVEISKLRFFLSLIVDEKVDDSKPGRGIVPLPNLEFKFVAANSLIGLPKAEGGFAESHKDIEKLRELRDAYFTAYGDEKRRIEKEFKETQNKMFMHALNWQATGSQTYKLSEWNPFEDEASSWFDPEWMFGIKHPVPSGHPSIRGERPFPFAGEAFPPVPSPLAGEGKGEGGFDIVIANPPYVRHESIKAFKPQLSKQFGDFYCGTADIYTYFYKRGIDLLKSGGHLCFIAPNKFMRAGYGKNTRTLLTTEVTPQVVIDFCDLPIFDATTYPSIILVEKTTNPPSPPFAKVGNRSNPPLEKGDGGGFSNNFLAATFTDTAQLERLDETLSSIGFRMPVSALKEEGWNLERPEVLALMEKLRKAGTPLGEYVQGKFYYGIKTGLNEAFVIDAETRKRLITEDPKSKELIKPWLRGRDIKKWKAEWAGLYVINIPSSANRPWPWSDEKTEAKAKKIFAQTYPAIHKHLSQWEDKLVKRDDQGKFWWELRSCAYYKEFERPKIIYPDIAKAPEFTWDASKSFLGNTAYIIPTDERWLVGLLNSQLIWWLYLNISSTIRGGFVRFIAQYMEQLPIPKITDEQKSQLTERVQKILADPDSPEVPRLEAEINKLVYALYGLTPEEVEIVEGRG
ncbi:MAG: Eco57I restriction-modification methylase domain-containing protein [Thermodesulfobacteriota bacterium]